MSLFSSPESTLLLVSAKSRKGGAGKSCLQRYFFKNQGLNTVK